MKKGAWNDSEVKNLFETVEETKKNNLSLRQAFEKHALKYKRKPNSVRNFYYQEIDELSKNDARAKKLKIDLGAHKKNEINYFSLEEENTLMEKIEDYTRQGMSIRRACLTLSSGDIDQMLRYQNKYRNFLQKKEKPDNIIEFKKKKSSLSESDINALFMGLVRLVKRAAMEELSDKLTTERESQNSLLRKTMLDLNKKEKEIQQLKEDFLNLKMQNAKLVQSMIKIRCEKVTSLSGKEIRANKEN